MNKSHNDEDGKKERRTNLANTSMTDLKMKDSYRRVKSSYGDIPDSPEVTAEIHCAIRADDEDAELAKGGNKHRPKGAIRTKRYHSSDDGSVRSSSSSSSSSCSSHKRDKKRKRSSSSRKRRRKEEKRRQKASKRTKKKKRSKSRDFESSSDDDANVRRSAITGRRIKMHVDKDAGDLVLEKARKDFLRYVNSSL